jgi:iron-sulfur cluster repair protein YtfE (RIC family)
MGNILSYLIMSKTLFLFFDDLLFHLKKEEQIIFPKIIQLTEKKLQEGTFNYSTLEIIKEYSITMQNEHLGYSEST